MGGAGTGARWNRWYDSVATAMSAHRSVSPGDGPARATLEIEMGKIVGSRELKDGHTSQEVESDDTQMSPGMQSAVESNTGYCREGMTQSVFCFFFLLFWITSQVYMSADSEGSNSRERIFQLVPRSDPKSGTNKTSLSPSSSSKDSSESSIPLRIIQLNVMGRGAEVLPWILNQSKKIDVMGLCEANALSRMPKSSLLNSSNYSYVEFFKTSHGFPLGVLSHTPIEVVGLYEDKFQRGVLHVSIRGVDFFVVHLHAHDAVKRSMETARLVELVTNVQNRSGNKSDIIIMGDLNTLSPLDAGYLQNMTLRGRPFLDALVTYPCYKTLRNKFLVKAPSTTPSTTAPTWKFGFGAVENLLAGDLFVDISHHRRPTEPTNIDCDQARGCPCPHLRLDYILATTSIARRGAGGWAAVVVNSETASLSDHYPVAARVYTRA